jgi:hypothetical protein
MTVRLGRKIWPQRSTAALSTGLCAGLASRVEERRAANPARPIAVWAFDEHRVGLKPILRRPSRASGSRP